MEKTTPSNIDLIKMYTETWDEFKKEIEQTKQKLQRAMRVTMILKVIVAFASITAIGAWLKDHGHKEIWAMILIFSEIADMLFDTLPYFQQRITLPPQITKLDHIEVDLKQDLLLFETSQIDKEEALRRYFSHRRTWIKTVQD